MPNIATWRAMKAADIPAVDELSARVHIDYPERRSVLEEKFALFPKGCFTLTERDGAIYGYCFSHPWLEGVPPSLDTFLETLPKNPSSYFIHDLTLDPSMQRRSLAGRLVPTIVDIAKGIRVPQIALVAVSGSQPFWMRMGFRKTDDPALQAAARRKYDESAVHMQRDLT
ncbi:GNAT family N-acetyltransferase [Pseudorhodoplanes sinuspersici]|uniref:Uncharacterized protein n=1 Tax=Pseudorhodoplanes sinuspersici TaxID=1235591 RepID=A0A1W6ZMC7_9HYPH|nr:GNAT family N-acetyltransferase [Pseudorhodoplanes sinuspersici]ARP98472.1 hypothetical protein CAK95_04735 [Pseudorhodoplanes sinuspersici]RKE66147.1 N-acetylglutamate synthase-like GNAT family acetyltransferase [Pseudorhodoplanes sinuspersici]